jgi:hypothetical protein
MGSKPTLFRKRASIGLWAGDSGRWIRSGSRTEARSDDTTSSEHQQRWGWPNNPQGMLENGIFSRTFVPARVVSDCYWCWTFVFWNGSRSRPKTDFLSVEPEVGGSSPPNCTTQKNPLYFHQVVDTARLRYKRRYKWR